MFYEFRIVERFLLDDYEERQLSTFALTMYRYDAQIEGKNYKVSLFIVLCEGQKISLSLLQNYLSKSVKC